MGKKIYVTIIMAENIDLSTIQNNDIVDEALDDLNNDIKTPTNTPNNIEEIKPINTIEKRRLILIIQRYTLEFDKYLGSLNKSASELEDFTEDQLKNLLDEIKFTVSVRNSGKMSERAVLMGIQQLENFCVAFTPLNIRGLSNICNDDDFKMTVKEFCLENINLFYVPASYRMAYALLMAGMNLHVYNTSIANNKVESVTSDKSAKIDSINEKFDKIN
jgi:hypothetical protein